MSDDGGAAYPSLQKVFLPGTGQGRPEFALVGGMSLRDHYVGQLLANPNIVVANFYELRKASREIAQAVEIIADACIEAKRSREAEEVKDNG